MKNKFYVYAYFEPGQEQPFYIGKGFGQRAFQHTCKCRLRKYKTYFYNKLRNLISRNISPQIIILQENMIESEAFELEKRLIAFFKRVCDGGTLCNHTSGGEGSTGYRRQTPVTEKERENRSKAQRGKKRSIETRQKLSKVHKGLKRSLQSRRQQQKIWENRVPNIQAFDLNSDDTVYVFKSTRDAGRLGFDRAAIYKVIKGQRKSHKGYGWRQVESK